MRAIERASSDPTPLKPGNAGGGKGPQFKTWDIRNMTRVSGHCSLSKCGHTVLLPRRGKDALSLAEGTEV